LNVVFSWGVELDFILKPRASAAFHGHAQGLTLFSRTDLGQTRKRALGHFGGKIHLGHRACFVSVVDVNIRARDNGDKDWHNAGAFCLPTDKKSGAALS